MHKIPNICINEFVVITSVSLFLICGKNILLKVSTENTYITNIFLNFNNRCLYVVYLQN